MIQGISNFMQNELVMKALRQIKVIILIFLTCSIAFFFNCNRIEEQSYDEVRFNSKLEYGSVTDLDGNAYRTIQIGTQVWMAENLKVSRYSDGSAITLVQDPKPWEALYSDGYCEYENIYEVYGRLYNYYSVASEHKLCPSGWHLPDNSDWQALSIFLGGEEIAGGKLREAGPIHWGYYNTLATNESGFTALPGGLRDHRGSVYSMGNHQGGAGYWWSSSVNDSSSAWMYSIGSEDLYLRSTPMAFKRLGLSVRCIKD